MIETIIAAIITFFAGLRLSRLNAKKIEIEIFENIKVMYLEAQKIQKKEIENLKIDIINVQLNLTAAVKKADLWEGKHNVLLKKYNSLTKLYTALKRDFEKQKK